MGDVRFQRVFERVRRARNPADTLRSLRDEEVVQALAGASLGHDVDPFLANVLATEAANRIRRAHVITEHIGEGVVAVDEQGRVTFANAAAAHMVGWTAPELVGEPIRARLHTHRPDGSPLPPEECNILRALERGTVSHAADDDVFTRKDGTRFPVGFTSVPVEREGEVVGVVVVFHDRTWELERERALRESEQRFRRLFEEQPDPAFAMDDGGVLTLVNAAGERVTGREVSELVGSHFGTLVVERDLPRTFEEFRRVMSGRSTRFPVCIRRPDGREVHLDITAFPLRERERVRGAWGLARERSAAATPD